MAVRKWSDILADLSFTHDLPTKLTTLLQDAYDTGYQDAESCAYADWQMALDEAWDFGDSEIIPTLVADLLRYLDSR